MPERSSSLETSAIFAASSALGSVGVLGAMTGSVILLSAFALALLVWLLFILPPLLRAEASRKFERAAGAQWVETNRVDVSGIHPDLPPEN